MSTIVNTEYKLPQSIVGNGVTTGNQFSNPNNLLLLDGETADSQSGVGELSDIIVGNFNLDLPQNAVITGIQLKLVAERGSQTSPVITITPVLVNDLSGVNEYYPGDTFSGLTEDLEEHILGNQYDLWGKVWTVDEINNLKVQLIPAGDVRVDSVLPKVFYYIAEDPLPPNPIETGCEDCNSTIEALPFILAKTFRIDETKFILKSFSLIDGTPIDLSMLGDCGGEITVTFDQGQYKIPGQNFQEDAVITSADATITTLPNGFVEIDLGTINNRGLMPIKPYTHDPDLLSEHSVGTKVIISNSARYQNRFLQKCHIGVLVSAPIKTLDENNEVVSVTENFNFIGDTIQAEQDDINPKQANVTVISNPTNTTPEVEDTTTGTTGSTPATSLTIEHEITDANYLRVWISTENETIDSVEYDGVPMTFIAEEINAPENLKIALYGLVNPNIGVHDIVINMNSAVNITAGGVSFLNVDTTNPTDGVSSGAIGTSTAPSDSITTTVNNTVVQDVVGTTNNPTSFTQSGLWTIRGQVNAADRTGASSTRKVLVPGTVTDTYAISGSYPWAIIIAGVRGAVLPSAAYVQSVTGTYMDDTDPQNVVSVVPLNNTAIVAPTVTDDSSAGYAVDSKWFDKLTGTLYTCEDATVGAAVWTAIVSATPGTLDVQLNGSTVENPVNTINIIAPSGTVTNPAPGVVDIDMSGFGAGGSGVSQGKPMSFYGKIGLSSGNSVNGYHDTEAVFSANSTSFYLADPTGNSQERDFQTDWAGAEFVKGHVLLNGYLYLLLTRTSATAESRVYRYDATNLSLGGTLVTFSGATLGTNVNMTMTSNGVNFFFTFDTGNSANAYEISKFTLSGTVLTYVSTTTCTTTTSGFSDSLAVDINGNYIGTKDGSLSTLFICDNTGTQTSTQSESFTIVDFLNWTNTIYGFISTEKQYSKLYLPNTDDSSTGTGSGGSSGPYPGTMVLGGWNTGTPANQSVESFGGYIRISGSPYKTGAFGKAPGGIGAFFNTSGIGGNIVCHDYSINKAFVLTLTPLGSGNFTLTLTMYDALTAASEATWTCSGTSSFAYPTPLGLNLVVDFQSLKAFFRTTTLTGSVSIDTTTVASNTTYVFDLSSASGGTINGTATSFTGSANFPIFSTMFSGSGEIALINSTTKKFITATDDNKYTYSDTLGITATNTISFGDYSGRNTVMPDGNLYKTQLYSVPGGSSGITSIYTDFIETYYVPTSNTILNT